MCVSLDRVYGRHNSEWPCHTRITQFAYAESTRSYMGNGRSDISGARRSPRPGSSLMIYTCTCIYALFFGIVLLLGMGLHAFCSFYLMCFLATDGCVHQTWTCFWKGLELKASYQVSSVTWLQCCQTSGVLAKNALGQIGAALFLWSAEYILASPVYWLGI